jgi:hypothetical protein
MWQCAYFLVRDLQKLPIADGWVLLLSGISDDGGPEGFEFEAVELVVLGEWGGTSSYLLGQPSKRTLNTLVCSYLPTM